MITRLNLAGRPDGKIQVQTRGTEASSSQGVQLPRVVSPYLSASDHNQNEQCFGEIKNGGFFKNESIYMYISFEPPSGFGPPIAQTTGPVDRKSSSHLQLDPSLSGTVRAFSRIFPQLRRTVIFTRIDPRCILELVVDISHTIEQCISVIAQARAFVHAIGGSNPPSASKVKKIMLPFF